MYVQSLLRGPRRDFSNRHLKGEVPRDKSNEHRDTVNAIIISLNARMTSIRYIIYMCVWYIIYMYVCEDPHVWHTRDMISQVYMSRVVILSARISSLNLHRDTTHVYMRSHHYTRNAVITSLNALFTATWHNSCVHAKSSFKVREVIRAFIIMTQLMYTCILWGGYYRSLLRNMVSFLGLFCKRDL